MKWMRLHMVAVAFLVAATAAAWADWTASRRLTWTSGASLWQAVAVDASGHIHVVWVDETPGNYEIYYKRSADGGTTWTAPQRLTWNSGSSVAPAIVAQSPSYLHVVWYDNTAGNHEIYYKKSTNGGTTWAASTRLTWTAGESWQPELSIDSSSQLHLVWHDDTAGNREIYYKKSTNGGATWTPNQRLTWNAGSSWPPVVAVDATDSIHVVWGDDTTGNDEIYYKKSANGGTSWTPSRRLTWTFGVSDSPDLVADSASRLHVVWQDNTPENFEIYYKKSSDGGTTWTTSERLTWTEGLSNDPSIVTDSSGNVYAAWADMVPWNTEIHIKKSTDSGTTWATSQRLTWTTGNSWGPAMAVDSLGTVHMVWDDITPGNLEVYYKKGT